MLNYYKPGDIMDDMVAIANKPEDFQAEGLTPEPSMKEDGIRLPTSKGNFEWWYFDAHLDDGTTVIGIFFTKSYVKINVPLTPMVKLNIKTPQGKTYLKWITFGADEFSASEDQCDVKVGKNWVKGDLKTYRLHIDFDDIAADLTFNRVVPSWRPGTGKGFFGHEREKFFGWFIAIPYGTVSGSIRYEGIERDVEGAGYHDHNWGNTPLNKIIDHWYWGRLDIGEYKAIFFNLTATKKYDSAQLPLFVFAKNDKILTGDGSFLTRENRRIIDHKGGRQYPEEIIFHWENEGDKINIHLSDPDILEDRSLLSSLPPLKRKLAGLRMNPYYFRFDSKIKIDVDFEDINESIEDKGLYEIMMLK